LDLSSLDPFLVGEGSFESLKDFRKKNLSGQLFGIDSITKLAQASDLGEVRVREDDTKDFCSEEILVDDLEKVFLEAKKDFYSIFGFLEYKSGLLDTPMREKDLILSEEDLYTIDYLQQQDFRDYFAVVSIGTLSACVDTLVHEVMFVNTDNCSMCRSFAGKIFPTRTLLQQLCSGSVLVHPFCSCGLFPVIDRFTYKGPLSDLLNSDIENVMNVPREFQKDICKLLPELDYGQIIFTDMSSYLSSKGLTSDKVSAGAVVYEDDGNLIIHDSWVSGKSPVDFLKNWISLREEKCVDTKNIEDPEVFYLRGKKVVEVDGEYFDFETGRRI